MCPPSDKELARINRFLHTRCCFGQVFCWPLSKGWRADLDLFAFQNKQKGNGRGRRLMRIICNWADKNKCSIWLYTYNFSLVRYYHDFGFELTDYDRLHMVRQPQ